MKNKSIRSNTVTFSVLLTLLISALSFTIVSGHGAGLAFLFVRRK